MRTIAVLVLLAGCGRQTPPSETPDEVHPRLFVSERIVDFGMVPAGRSARRTLVLENRGGSALAINRVISNDERVYEVSLDCPGFGDETEHQPCVLAPGESRELQLTVRPFQSWPTAASVRIETGGLDGRDITTGQDPRRAKVVVGMRATSCGRFPELTAVRTTELGHLDGSRTITLPFYNQGPGTAQITGVTAEGCTAAWSGPSAVELGQLGQVEAVLVPDGEAPGSCHIRVSWQGGCDDPTTQEADTQVVWNRVPREHPAEVRFVSPAPGTRVERADAVTLSLAFEHLSDDVVGCELTRRTTETVVVGSCMPEAGADTAQVEVPASALPFGEAAVFTATLYRARAVPEASADLAVRLDVDAAPDDADGDGFGTVDGVLDCDDSDPRAFASAHDGPDGVDNDCDGTVDEGQDRDQDRDGYTVADGDCDDFDPNRSPARGESRDFVDNDCDGLVDEDTITSDDDRDGWSEAEGDCDDADPAVAPQHLEWCESAADDDCDGVLGYDERDCVSPAPGLVGELVRDRSALDLGEPIELEALVLTEDGVVPQLDWTAAQGEVTPTGPTTARWTPIVAGSNWVRVEGPGPTGRIRVTAQFAVFDAGTLPREGE